MPERCKTCAAWFFFLCLFLTGCASATPLHQTTAAPNESEARLGSRRRAPSTYYPLTGDTDPVRDPSIMREGRTYYAFSTDPGASSYAGYLPIRCSENQVHWTACGYVFSRMPAWISSAVPGATDLWAPDISYFGGVYHLYYAASTISSQRSAIGEATNVTLDPFSPEYQWVDHGKVIASHHGDDFNAIDPNILVDDDGSVFLTFGSYWSGIKQRRLDPSTGMLADSDTTVHSLAKRPESQDYAIEGPSLVHHGHYYYLFFSVGHSSEADYRKDDYQQAVGRATEPSGPFVDKNGVDLMEGGGTVLLTGNANWSAPGGGTAYIERFGREGLFVFHAADASQGGTPYLWLKQISWQNDWPVLE